MQVVKELDRSERDKLKEKHKCHSLFATHIEVVLNRPFCYRVNVYASDYARILIYSCLPNTTDRSPYQYASEAITYIQVHEDFLNTSSSGCLSGTRVRHYMDELRRCQSQPRDCFIMLGECFMLDKGETSHNMRNEITDGMHRLVAYGLTTNLNEGLYPIPAYLGTDKTLESVETIWHINRAA
jgi:hypothetical protein